MPHQEYTEVAGEKRDRKPHVGVDPPKLRNDDISRHHDHLAGDHHLSQHQHEQEISSGEVYPGQGVPGHGVEEDVAGGNDQGH